MFTDDEASLFYRPTDLFFFYSGPRRKTNLGFRSYEREVW